MKRVSRQSSVAYEVSYNLRFVGSGHEWRSARTRDASQCVKGTMKAQTTHSFSSNSLETAVQHDVH